VRHALSGVGDAEWALSARRAEHRAKNAFLSSTKNSASVIMSKRRQKGRR